MKKILSTVLVGAMLTSMLAGCGGNTKAPETTAAAKAETTAAAAETTAAAAETEAPAAESTSGASVEGKTVAFIPKLTGNAFFEVANDGAQEFAKKWNINVNYMGSSSAAVADQVSVIN